MSKRRIPVTSFEQPSLFDPPRPQAGAPFAAAVRETLNDVLATTKERGLDRFKVAEAMSRLDPEREVTKRMLDNYAAPGADPWRFPLELVPSLYVVTGDPRLVLLTCEACDHKALPGEAAALGELMVLEMKERRIREQKRALARQLSPEARAYAEAEAARRTSR